MLDLNNIPGVEVRNFCGIPVDKSDGVVLICGGEVVGSAVLEYDDETVELEVCQKHFDDLTRFSESATLE